MNLLFAIEAGPEYGMGHLLRCRPLLQAWHQRDEQACLWLRGRENVLQNREWPPVMKRFVDPAISAASALSALLDHVCRHQYDYAIIDGYGLAEAGAAAALSAEGIRVLSIDDIGGQTNGSSLVLNPNTFDDDLYREKRGTETKLLLGPGYALIDQDFTDPINTRSIPPHPERIIISFGAVDRKGRSLEVLTQLLNLGSPAKIDLIIGAYFPDNLRKQIPANDSRIKVHHNLPSLAPLMHQADLMICSASTTAWQACASGLPLVILQTVDNQAAVLETVLDAEAALGLNISHNDANIPVHLLHGLLKKALDPKIRESLSINAKKLVDGQGATHVLDEMITF